MNNNLICGYRRVDFRKGHKDCVVRAIAVATESPYESILDDLMQYSDDIYGIPINTKKYGIIKDVYRAYLFDKGWKWKPTMGIGTGCQVHLRPSELPHGRIICEVSRHLVAVIDGVIWDNHMSDRNGTRCVYGYYHR